MAQPEHLDYIASANAAVLSGITDHLVNVLMPIRRQVDGFAGRRCWWIRFQPEAGSGRIQNFSGHKLLEDSVGPDGVTLHDPGRSIHIDGAFPNGAVTAKAKLAWVGGIQGVFQHRQLGAAIPRALVFWAGPLLHWQDRFE